MRVWKMSVNTKTSVNTKVLVNTKVSGFTPGPLSSRAARMPMGIPWADTEV